MSESTKARSDRLLSMSRGELIMHAQDLTLQRDDLIAALKALIYRDGGTLAVSRGDARAIAAMGAIARAEGREGTK